MLRDVFGKSGFDIQYREKMENFYRDIIGNDNELSEFFKRVFKHDETDKTPRRIMNNIQQLVSLADDIDTIRPQRDPLRIFFLRTCNEAVYKLYNEGAATTNKKEIDNFFDEYLLEEGQNYILEHFKLTEVDYHAQADFQSGRYIDNKQEYSLTIKDFALLFYKTRGMVTHEGDYWSLQYFSRSSDDTIWCTHVETDEKILTCVEREKNKKYTYYFETTMNYELFRKYFVLGCLRILDEYISLL